MPLKPFLFPFTGLVPLVSLLLAMSACTPENPAPPPPPPAKVSAMPPIRQEVTGWDEYTGRLEAVETVEIRGRVSGYLDQVRVRDGETVHKGDLLFQIDPRPYEAELKRAEAEQARIRSSLELARSELAHAERLRQTRAISGEEYDQRAKSMKEFTAATRSAEAAVQSARLNLEFTRIRSPIDGRISRELLTPGNLVNSDQTLLATIVSVDPVYVYLDADERSALKYRRLSANGQRGDQGGAEIHAELGLIDEQGYPHQGRIDYVEPRLDPGTGTLRIRGLFPNPDGILGPGLFARVRIQGGPPAPALLIPGRAIVSDQDQKYVWLAKPDGSTEYRRIVPAGQFGSFRAIREGLNPDDRVIVDGLPHLRPGVRVQAEPASIPYDG